MKIIIGADHNGFEHKRYLTGKLEEAGHTVIDVGPSGLDPEDDYPDFATPLALKVSAGEGMGIFICGSGNGPCMVANKVHGIRAGVARTPDDAKGIRSHQDANIICIGAQSTDEEMAWKIVETFLKTPFDGGRHQRRIDKIMKLES